MQLNRSSSSIKVAAEVAIDNHVMRLKGQTSQTKLGFKQVFELYHSLPQVQMKFSSINIVPIHVRLTAIIIRDKMVETLGANDNSTK